eukprot:PhF_6_TR30544/c0_g1_i1/m.44832/K01276/DPP7; dipeptidyl-peptidase II
MMVNFVILLCLTTLSLLVSAGRQTLNFTQPLDHTTSTDTRTFQERYFYDDTYYKPGGPLLFYCGGEGPIDHLPIGSGAVLYEYGQQFNGLIVYAEHRYYGQTLPFGNTPDNWTPDNIQYLTIPQALSDYKALINSIRKSANVTGPVVAFGGSYPGELAAWLRINHPKTVDMALASSAPFRMWFPQVDPRAWYHTVTKVYSRMRPLECPDLVRLGFEEIISAVKTGRSAVLGLTPEDVRQQLGLCDAPTQASLFNLTSWVVVGFANLAMENLPWSTDVNAPPFPMDAGCIALASNPSQPLVGLRTTMGYTYNSSGTLSCFSPSDENVPCADFTGCGVGGDSLSWDWQSCTQIAHDAGTYNDTDMFPVQPYDKDTLDAYCKKTWGTNIDFTFMPNMYKAIVNTTRLIVSNGLLDPWHVGGVMDVKTQVPGGVPGGVVTVKIAEGAHHADLWGTHPSEPTSLTAARAKELETLSMWIKEFHKEKGEE